MKQEDLEQLAIGMKNMMFNFRQLVLKSKKHIKLYKTLRKVHGEVIDSMILYHDNGKYDINKQIENAICDVMKELNGDLSKFKFEFHPDNSDDMNVYYNLVIYPNHPKLLSITEDFLNRNKFKNKEKVKMLNAMKDSYIGLFKIVEIDSDNAYVTIEDIYTKKRFKIIDISLSMPITDKNFYLYTRIITVDDISFGAGLMSFKNDDKKLLQYLKEHKNKKVTDFIRTLDLYEIYKKSNVKTIINNIE